MSPPDVPTAGQRTKQPVETAAAIIPVATAVAAVADTAVPSARCSPQPVLTAGKKRACRFSPAVTNRCTVPTASPSSAVAPTANPVRLGEHLDGPGISLAHFLIRSRSRALSIPALNRATP